MSRFPLGRVDAPGVVTPTMAGRRRAVCWVLLLATLAAGMGVAPAASALPTPPRPAFAEDGATDEVVIAPGEADATGRIPLPLGQKPSASAKGRIGVPGPPGGQLGARSVIVLRVDYAGDPVNPQASGQPFTEAAIRSRLTGAALSASSIFSAQSAGAVSLTGISNAGGDVSPWISLAGSVPVAANVSPTTCDHTKIARDAFAKANQSFGIDVTRYDNVVIVFPDWPDDPALPGDQGSPCGWSGLGEVPGSTTWINGLYAGQDDLDAAVIAHELGHNLGVAHASTVGCTEGSGATVALRTGCALSGAVEYGDPFDLMGGGFGNVDAVGNIVDPPPPAPWLGSALMSSWHRAQLLQLPDAAQRTITANGTYELTDARTGTGVRLLRIARGTGTADVAELVIERRSGSLDFDRWTTFSPAVPDGVLIRLAPTIATSKRSVLLDMHPATKTNKDAPLAVGETFEDRAAGITIKLASLDGGRAQLEIGDVRLPTPTAAPTPLPTAAPAPTAAPVAVITPVPTIAPSPTPSPTPKENGSGGAGASAVTATLVRPSASSKRRVASNGRVTVMVPGAGRIVVKAGSRTLTSVRRSTVTFTLPRALRRNATVQLTATGGALSPTTVRATLRVKARVAKLTTAR